MILWSFVQVENVKMKEDYGVIYPMMTSVEIEFELNLNLGRVPYSCLLF